MPVGTSDDSYVSKRMKLSPRQVTLAVIGMLLLISGAWAYFLYSGPQRAVGRYKSKLPAAGEHLTVGELIPAPPLPERNSASLFYELLLFRSIQPTLLDTNPPLAMSLVAPGRALVGSRQPALLEQGTNSWEELASCLGQNCDVPEALQQLIEQPLLDFALDYRQGFNLLLPHLAPLKNAARRLSAATVLDIHRGDLPSATMHVRAMLALVKGMREERLVISQLVRFAMTQIAMATTWELLQSPDLTDEQLAALQRDWLDLQFVPSTEAALAMERAMGDKLCEEMRSSSSKFRSALSLGGGLSTSTSVNSVNDIATLTAIQAKETLWRVAWSYPDQLRALRGHQVLLETLRALQAGGDFKASLENQRQQLFELGILSREENSEGGPILFDSSGPELRMLFTRSVQTLHRVTNRLLAVEVARQLTVTALALKRYALKHGTYPPDLAALVPEFIDSVPLDPVDRRPLRYHVDPDGGFSLYSIGEDGQDNGGDASSAADSKSLSRIDAETRGESWHNGRDQVWPRPATPEQVEAHFKKLTDKRKR